MKCHRSIDCVSKLQTKNIPIRTESEGLRAKYWGGVDRKERKKKWKKKEKVKGEKGRNKGKREGKKIEKVKEKHKIKGR